VIGPSNRSNTRSRTADAEAVESCWFTMETTSRSYSFSAGVVSSGP